MENDKTLILIADNDPLKAQEVARGLGGIIDTSKVHLAHAGLNGPSLMGAIADFSPSFFARIKETSDLGRKSKINHLIVNAASTDSHLQKCYYLDQALRELNGEDYKAVIENVKKQNLADGVIDHPSEFHWETGSLD